MGGTYPGLFKFPVSMRDGCNGSSYGLSTDVNANLVFYITDRNGNFIASPAGAGSTLWDGNWHNVGGTYDGRTVRFYLDGAQVGSGTQVPVGTMIDYGNDGTSGAIGGYTGACGDKLDLRGDVDGVQIWSQALPIDTIWRTLKTLLTSSR